MSRSRRLPRHRRTPTLVRTTAPLALGGAVAAVALTASPLADALHRRDGGAATAEAGGTGRGPDVLMIEPADQGTTSAPSEQPAAEAGRTTDGRPASGSQARRAPDAPSSATAVPTAEKAPGHSGSAARTRTRAHRPDHVRAEGPQGSGDGGDTQRSLDSAPTPSASPTSTPGLSLASLPVTLPTALPTLGLP